MNSAERKTHRTVTDGLRRQSEDLALMVEALELMVEALDAKLAETYKTLRDADAEEAIDRRAGEGIGQTFTRHMIAEAREQTGRLIRDETEVLHRGLWGRLMWIVLGDGGRTS